MAVYTLKTTSDIEKRLKILRQQLYGKEDIKSSAIKYSAKRDDRRPTRLADGSMSDDYFVSDTAYLYKDLAKIGLFSSLAIGSQLVLFFLIQNHVLNLNF